MTATALIPSRDGFNPSTHAGALFLQSAGFRIHQLVNYSSIFDAYGEGVGALHDETPDDIVLLLHDDVFFDGITPDAFMRALRRPLSMPNAGFVGVAGCRTLSRDVAWWRNASGATALAGTVHHGVQMATAERAFFGPPGRVVMLDGVLLAATVRTLRRFVRLDAPAGLRRLWHFYDLSATLQAHAAGLVNIALPLGVVHGSKGKPDESWEGARAALAERLRPLLPISVPDAPALRPHKRVAVLLRSSTSERRLQGANANVRAALVAGGYDVLSVDGDDDETDAYADEPSAVRYETSATERSSRDSVAASIAAEARHPFAWLDAAAQASRPLRFAPAAVRAVVDALAALHGDDTVVLASARALSITPPADIDVLIEAALTQPRTLASPLGCRAACADGAAGTDDADVGLFMELVPQSERGRSGGAAAAAVAGAGGALSVRAPASRVERFAPGGMLAAKWSTFRELHASLGSDVRARLARAMEDSGSRALVDLPVETLYAHLARRLPEHKPPVYAEVVPLMALHLAPAMGKCLCIDV